MKKLKDILNEWFDLEEVDINQLLGSYFDREISNIEEFTEGKYSTEEIKNNVSVYGIKRNDKSEKYFSEPWGHLFPLETLNGTVTLLVISFEQDNYEYFTSNSTRLVLDLTMALGITEEDIMKKTDKYYSYKSAKNILDNYDDFI